PDDLGCSIENRSAVYFCRKPSRSCIHLKQRRYMQPNLASLIVVIALTRLSLAQTSMLPVQGTPSATAPAIDRIGPGTLMLAELSKSLDAKKFKPGDKVEAKLTVDLLAHGQIVIPRNVKIIGHVTDAKS